MADVSTPMWAPFPKPLPPSPVATARNSLVGQSHYGIWSTPIAKPGPQRRAEELANARIQGTRAVEAVDSIALRNRLDEEHPTGPEAPTEGFSAMAIEPARRGREQVRTSVETRPAITYAKWRSLLRTQGKHGLPEEEAYDHYEDAATKYICRRRNEMQ